MRKNINKILTLFFILLIPLFAQAYSINDNLEVYGQITRGINRQGVNGITLDLTSGRLKIQCNGADCSSSNPGTVYMKSATTPGSFTRLPVTVATHFFDDDTAATSDIAGEEFGTTAGTAWGSSRPFYDYAVNCSGTLYFATSANDNAHSSPVTANIGYHNNPAATPSDENFFFWTSTDVTSTCAGQPALLIASHTMTKSSSDDWTVDTFTNRDGIGKIDQCGRIFQMPNAQMGAASGTLVHANGGTASTYSNTNLQDYSLCHGLAHYYGNQTNSVGGVAGSGAVTLRISLPYKSRALSTTIYGAGTGFVVNGNPSTLETGIIVGIPTGATYLTMFYQSTIANGFTAMTNALQNQTNRQIAWDVKYQAF